MDAAQQLQLAAHALAVGDLVAFPTETVYGLGADAGNPLAVAKIFALKGRPADHPLIVHVVSQTEVPIWARDVPLWACHLMDAFWPGPLTLVLPRTVRVPLIVTGGQETVALRCPAHPLATQLLRACLKLEVHGLAGPSANRHGRVSPTTAQHVIDEFGPDLIVLDGGPCAVGIESTIVDCTGEAPMLLRPGQITAEQVVAVAGKKLRSSENASIRVSGNLPAHYQPLTPVRLSTVGAPALPGEAVFGFVHPPGFAGRFVQAPDDAAGYARVLYATLRELDQCKLDMIVVQVPPFGEHWMAIHDRLQRASHRTGN